MNFSHATTRRLSIGLTMGGLVALGLVVYRPILGQAQRDLIIQPVDESQLVTLRGNTRPEAANPKNDRGPVPDSFALPHMLLQLKRSPALEGELSQYIEQLTDKSSPNFHKWLTAAQIGETYGPSQSDLSTIRAWLESHGFTVEGVTPNRMVIDISGTAANLRGAFHTQVDYLEVNGKAHFANMSDPEIPQALAPAIVGLVQVHNFEPKAMAVPSTNYTFAGCTGLPTLPGTCYALVPADFQTIYNVNPLFRQGILGQGQSITVVEDSDTYSNDVAVYRSTFLSKYSGTVTTTHPTGASACADPGTNAADGEADLDAEVASAIVPDASIVVATCADTTTFGGLLAIQNLVNSATPPSIISLSYGECEAFNGAASNAAFNSAYQTGAGVGTSIFVSSGDAGASGCAPNYGTDSYAYPGLGITGWGETIYNVSVGGTDFEDTYNAAKPANGSLPLSSYWSSTNLSTYGSAKSYIPEIPWNDSCASFLIYNLAGYTASAGSAGFCNSSTGEADYLSIGSGAGGPSSCATGGGGTNQTNYAEVDGTCAGYAKPSWQSGVFGNPGDGVRDIPDVSMFASNGVWGHYVIVCFSDTSQSGSEPCTGAPSTWSGFGGTSVAAPTMASVQVLVNQYNKLKNIGNPNPTYYAIANAEFGSAGNSACYSVNLPGRRGLESSCAFQDITQGDMDVNCRTNTSAHQVGCYLPSGTNGALSTQPVNTATIISGGSGYTSAPTCTIAAPSNLNQYISPQNTVIYAGGTQATCAANATATGTATISGTVSTSYSGVTIVIGPTTYTLVTGTPTAANQVELYTSGSATTNRTDTAKNLEAVVNATSSQCASTGCVFTGQAANSAVTATESGAVVTFTAKSSGTAGNFTLTSSNTADVAVSGGTFSGSISSITITNGGQGYTGGASCTLTGGGGSGATCSAYPTVATIAPSYQPAFGATPGWDMATGLGSVNAYNLAINPAW